MEEVSALKSKKSLFCTKPKVGVGTTQNDELVRSTTPFICEIDNADVRREINVNNHSLTLLLEASEENNEAKTASISNDIPRKNLGVSDSTGDDDGYKGGASVNDHNTSPPLLLAQASPDTPHNEVIGSAHVFQMRVYHSTKKKKVQVRRRLGVPGGTSSEKEESTGGKFEPITHFSDVTGVCKRKCEDYDVDMVDAQGVLKRSCIVSEGGHFQTDKVAAVGYTQPREQQ
ncbi:unnamed protein product [Amaranthus hypochondriacus]